jgi:pyruvate/2-oxoglutarate dehydrogenase complex dihydrolipoamide dehydrogenase (E3) component
MASLDPTKTYKAAIIGAGSGGLTLAIGLAGFGHDVVLIEGGDVGGDCTNVGCVPSKALLHAAKAGEPDPFGWARERRNHLRDEETAEMADHDQIVLVQGWASLTGRRDPHVVHVDLLDGGETAVHAEHVIVCAGSQPVRFDIEGLPADRLLTNEELFELTDVPAKVVLVGGGPISLEMATAFADMGTEVAIVELQDRLLATDYPAVSAAVEAALVDRGIAVHTGTTLDGFDAATDAALLADGTKIDGVDYVVLAVGRRPKLERLALDSAGVDHTKRGISVDTWGRTSVDGIWAVGDVTGASLTTHGANAMGRRAVRAIALPKVLTVGSPRAEVNAVYSRPEIASVGMTVAEVEALPEAGRRRYTVNLADIDRGYTDAIEHGLVVVDVERFTGKVLRASVVGPAAAEWIGIFTMAIDHGIGLRKMYGTVHPYPAHVQAIGKIVDDFTRDTLPSLPKEWLAMTRGRIAGLIRR